MSRDALFRVLFDAVLDVAFHRSRAASDGGLVLVAELASFGASRATMGRSSLPTEGVPCMIDRSLQSTISNPVEFVVLPKVIKAEDGHDEA